MNLDNKNLFLDNSVVICMLARDCEYALKRNLRKIDNLKRYFRKASIIVVENDSKDKTKEILLNWKHDDEDIHLIMEDTNSITFPKRDSRSNKLPGASAFRIEKMAMFRNRYMTYIHNNLKDIDYMIVIDIDIDDFDEKQIVKSIKNAPNDWNALFANGRRYYHFLDKKIGMLYYDGFAFVPYKNNVLDLTYKETFILPWKMSKNLKSSKYVPCISAFGGIGIYKYENLKNIYYSVSKNTRSEIMEVICEHISININHPTELKNYIVSDLKVFYEKIKGLGNLVAIILGYEKYIKLWEKIHNCEFPI